MTLKALAKIVLARDKAWDSLGTPKPPFGPGARTVTKQTGTTTNPATKPLPMRLEALDAAAPAGNERAALKRPPAWSNPVPPSPGCWCSCCYGRHWWAEAINPRGWRCSTCYPGDHLPMTRRQEIISDELG